MEVYMSDPAALAGGYFFAPLRQYPWRFDEHARQFQAGARARRGAIARSVKRIAQEIAERNGGADEMVLVGIVRRGARLAERIAEAMAKAASARFRSARSTFRPIATTAKARPATRACSAAIFRFRSTASASCWSTTSSTPDAPCAPRSTRCPISDAPNRFSSRCWSIAASASCRFAPTTSAKISRRRAASGFTCG